MSSSISRRFLVFLFRLLSDSVFRVQAGALDGVPAQGPLIIVMNHINILEIPLIYSRLQPRQVHGLVKASHWKNRLVAWGLNACGSIPLERGAGNLDSIKKALEVLSAGEIVLIMPEGTRSGDGQLQRASPGAVLLALKSHAPLFPIVTHGGEQYKGNLKRLRRTDFHITLGRPFTLKAGEEAVDSQTRKEIMEEVMYQVAALLPPGYRGAYANPPATAPRYLEFG
jgi:1-acyl-sn-glycerol-3-phosphate acyltransferase